MKRGRPWPPGWELPGGHCEPGEDPAVTAARETEEETGYTVRVEGIVGVYSWRGLRSAGDVVFLGHLPDVAGPRPTEDPNRLRVAVSDPSQQKARVPSARAGRKVISLHEHRVVAGLGEVVHEADPGDAAADDQDIGTIGQLARIGVGRPGPERDARAHDGPGRPSDGWIW